VSPEISIGVVVRDWDAIARDYAAGVLAVPEICALYGVSKVALYNRAQADDWVLRRAAGVRARSRTKADLAQRLLRALDLKMTQFEKRMMESAASGNAADGERDARTLNTLVQLHDKLTAAQASGKRSASQKAGGRASNSADDPPPTKFASMDTSVRDAQDAEQLRNELAERLGKLREQLGA